MTRRSLLLVAQLAPPSSLVAARRVAGLVKYLGRQGHEVTVLTSEISGNGPIEGAAEVVRTADLMASPLNWRRKHFAALTGQQELGYSKPSRLAGAIVPDIASVTWLPIAVTRALLLARRRSFDVVITTSPPQSSHVVGAVLHRRGTRWIAELRDGWTFEPPHPAWPLAAQARFDRALERSLLRRADAVVAVTEPIVEDARARLGVEATLITNGFDPDERQPRVGAHALLDPLRHSFVHTGRTAHAGVTLRPLLDALRQLRSQDEVFAQRLEVVFAGPLSAEERDLLSAPELAGLVRMAGSLERHEALALQREADTLLVITGGASRPSVATGKLFEYLGASRPIVVLGEETEAARIVAATSSGFAVPSDEPAAIAAGIRRAVEEPGDPGGDISPYSYDAIALQYAQLIERVCARP